MLSGVVRLHLDVLNNGRPNPFIEDAVSELTVASSAACVQANAWAGLLQIVDSVDDGARHPSGLGRLVLLSAPRAGYGKSHLIGRLRKEGAAKSLVVPMTINLERPVSWSTSLDQVLSYCHTTPSDAAGDVTLMSELTRRLFAGLNAELIGKGLVLCEEDKDKTVEALERRAVEIYSLTDTSSALGQWFLRNFESLLPAFAELMAEWAGVCQESAAEWLRVLCAYEQGQTDSASARWQSLQWGIRQISQSMQGGFKDGVQVLSVTSEGEQLSAKERLIEFLGLIGVVRTPIIAVDSIDVLYRDAGSCLRIADVLSQLTAGVPRSVTVLSVNDDVWNSGFRHHLPGALIDRLTGSEIRLRELNRSEAESLVRFRLEQTDLGSDDVERFVALLGLDQWIERNTPHVSPRTVLRFCSSRWTKFLTEIEVLSDQVEDNEHPSLFPEGDPKLGAPPKSTPPKSTKGLAPLKPLATAPAKSTNEAQSTPAELSPSENPIREAFDRRVNGRSDEVVPDPVRIAALMRIAGQQFPMVQYSEQSVPSGNGAPPALVGIWKTGDSELLFGLRPYEESGYWKSLAQFAATHGSEASKLTVFDSSDRQGIAALLVDEDHSHIDVVELDHTAVRRLSAASDLLNDAERGVLDVPVPQALAGLLDELDFFWKRVTRPAK